MLAICCTALASLVFCVVSASMRARAQRVTVDAQALAQLRAREPCAQHAGHLLHGAGQLGVLCGERVDALQEDGVGHGVVLN